MSTLTLQPTASGDDAVQRVDNTVAIIDGQITLDASGKWGGVRFPGIGIVKGATINTATLRLYLTSTKYDSPNTTIYGQAIDNAPSFTTTSNDISGRTRTTQNAPWVGTNLAGAGSLYVEVTVTTIVQALLNRAGWASGNAIAFVMQQGTGEGVAFGAYDGGTFLPQLVLDYTVPGAGFTGLGALSASAHLTTFGAAELIGVGTGGKLVTDVTNDFSGALPALTEVPLTWSTGDADTWSTTAGVLRVTGAGSPNSGGYREAIYFNASSAMTDAEVHSKWSAQSTAMPTNNLQQGHAHCITATRAVTISKNVAFSINSVINFHTMDGTSAPGSYSQIGSFDISAAVGANQLPWHMKSRVRGRILEAKVWRDGQAEPNYGDVGYSGSCQIPADYAVAGHHGLYAAHVNPNGATMDFDDVTVSRYASAQATVIVPGVAHLSGVGGGALPSYPAWTNDFSGALPAATAYALTTNVAGDYPTWSVTGGVLRATGPAGSAEGRWIWVPDAGPSQLDAEIRSRWVAQNPLMSQSAAAQQGHAHRITTGASTRCVTVTKNIFGAVYNRFNFHVWDTAWVGAEYRQFGNLTQDIPSLLNTELPWNMKSRVYGNFIEFAVWLDSEGEPAYGDPAHGGRAEIPDTSFIVPGKFGLYMGHENINATADFDNLVINTSKMASARLKTFGVAALTGTGAQHAVPANLAIVRSGIAALTGSGVASGRSFATISATAALSGTGSATALAALIPRTATVALSGTGSLSVTAYLKHYATAAVSGSGSLTASGYLSQFASASFAGTGTTGASATLTRFGAASLSGSGVLSTSSHLVTFATAALSGSGVVQAAATPGVNGKSALSGVGDLAASAAVVIRTASAALAGTSTLGAIPTTTVRQGNAALNGGGGLTGRAVATVRLANVALSGGGVLSATMSTTIRLGIAALNGVGGSAAQGTVVRLGAAWHTIIGVGALNASANGAYERLGVAMLAGVGDVRAQAIVNQPGLETVFGSAVFVGVGALRAYSLPMVVNPPLRGVLHHHGRTRGVLVD